MNDDYFFGSTDNADAELVVVQDYARAQELCDALLQAGLEHVKCLPDFMVSGKAGPQGRDFWDKLSEGTSSSQGPYHIVVWEEDLAKARQILADGGLQEG